MSIQHLFYPQGVAVVGSMGEGKLGNVLVKQLLDGGYSDLIAINPKAQGAYHVAGYESISSSQRKIDLAVIASPAQTVADVLEDCGKAGVKAAVIITSGFSETGNRDGEIKIKEIAQNYGIRFVGPNCAGIFNASHHLYPTLELRPPTGEVALISQSGALGGAVLSWAEEQGMGLSKFVSYGNRADLDEVDLLNYLADDPDTKVVAMYIESLADGKRFLEAASEFTKKKPLVVIKSGTSQSGSRATLSHTGSMAGADAVYDAALKQCGAIRVKSIEEMFDLCKGLAFLPEVKGKKIAIVTNSGGPGVLAADQAEVLGLNIDEPSDEIKGTLRTFLPGHCSIKNPVDLTVEGTEDTYRETLKVMLQDYDSALALNVNTPYMPSLPLARGIRDAQRISGKPVAVNFMAGSTIADSQSFLSENKIPNFATGERAVTVLAYMERYYRQKGKLHKKYSNLMPKEPAFMTGPVLEPDAMRWLKENQVPVPEYSFCTNIQECLEAGKRIGYPVVMKVVSPQIIHKSDVGGVILNIADDKKARLSFETLQKLPGFYGVMIYPMLKNGVEVIIGITQDVQFGPVVAFGMGGIFTEIMKDISLRVAPVDEVEASEMIEEIKSVSLLTGARGRKPVDIDQLAKTVSLVSRLPFYYPEIKEIDLNPVFVSPKGLVVGDVRIILKS